MAGGAEDTRLAELVTVEAGRGPVGSTRPFSLPFLFSLVCNMKSENGPGADAPSLISCVLTLRAENAGSLGPSHHLGWKEDHPTPHGQAAVARRPPPADLPGRGPDHLASPSQSPSWLRSSNWIRSARYPSRG